MGLIDHVSGFSASHGYREGWVLSNRFERSLREMADNVASPKDVRIGNREKDAMHMDFALASRQVELRGPPSSRSAVLALPPRAFSKRTISRGNDE